ncbi:hypothetical protein [Methylosarcina fibrata]|nr:hypothetical protein [Methylosarcina fibrata]
MKNSGRLYVQEMGRGKIPIRQKIVTLGSKDKAAPVKEKFSGRRMTEF